MSAVALERPTSVLLIEDDDDDYLLTRDLLIRPGDDRYQLERVSDYESGARALREGRFDVCLLDYRLGGENGVELVRELVAEGCETPMIVLTGQGDYEVDVEASAAGASDYIVKGEISSALLERTIRYALKTRLHLEALRTQEQGLREARRLEAVGQLAGGIAHDFNNLLLVIRGHSGFIATTTTDDRLQEHAAQIDRAADRAAELTRQLLAYSRQQILQPETTDLNVIVHETLRMLERLIEEDIELHSSFDPELPAVVVDRGQISQIVLNLAVNARDAMPDGGVLTIRTAVAELDANYAFEHAEVVPGTYVLLEMTDSGIGMNDSVRRRLFDPYFTTKETGTGLGLATVYGIVRQSGGHIWVYSEEGIGTTFKLYFPVGGSVDLPAAKAIEPGELDGTETVLVIEDADLVRNLVTQVLESFGYTVIAATNAREALELVDLHGDEIDLVFTDVVMPGMNGRELVDRLREQRPSLKVLFSSGYPADTVIRQGIATAQLDFIEKPYLSIELARTIRSVLDAGKH